jgi:uncharacterized protein YkwD
MHREPGRRSSHILLYVAPLAVLLVLGLLFARSFLAASSSSSDTAALASAVHGSPTSTSTSIKTDSATPVSAASATTTGSTLKDLGVAKGTFTLKGPAKAGKGSFVVFVLDGEKRVLKTDSSAPFAVKINTKALPNGRYEVTVLWVRSGRPSIASTGTVQISNAGPKKSTPPKVSPPSAGANTAAALVLSITNAERAKVGCKALKTNADLTKAAQGHSADMAKNNYFSHDSQDGRSPFDRMKDAGYSFSAAAENIAMGQLTPDAVMTAWMNSAGHKANILNCTYTQIGIGIAKDKGGAPYWTQDFGKPL